MVSSWKDHIRVLHHSRHVIDVAAFDEAQRNLQNALLQREIYWKQRSKQSQLQARDENTRYFHTLFSSRCLRNCIDKLRDASGVWHKGMNPLRAHMVSYFEGMFCVQLVNAFSVISCLSARVTDAHIVSLSAPFNAEEVRTTVFVMDPDKSTDLDGLNPGFFKHFQDIIRGDITSICLLILSKDRFPHDFNDSYYFKSEGKKASYNG